MSLVLPPEQLPEMILMKWEGHLSYISSSKFEQIFVLIGMHGYKSKMGPSIPIIVRTKLVQDLDPFLTWIWAWVHCMDIDKTRHKYSKPPLCMAYIYIYIYL